MPDGVGAGLCVRGDAARRACRTGPARHRDWPSWPRCRTCATGEPLLLAGSYATGEANPTSDLDLLVLTTESGSRAPAGSSNHPSIFGDSYDIQLADLTVNLEYVPQSRFLDLCEAVNDARDGCEVGNFQSLELRLAQRVTTGIGLTGPDVLATLRDQLDYPTVRASAAALSFVMAMSLLEDTQVLAPPGQLLMLRGAGEWLLRAAINTVGPITYDTKHLFGRAARLARDPKAPTALAGAEQLVFTERLPVAESVAVLLDHAQDLYRLLAAEPGTPADPGDAPALSSPAGAGPAGSFG